MSVRSGASAVFFGVGITPGTDSTYAVPKCTVTRPLYIPSGTRSPQVYRDTFFLHDAYSSLSRMAMLVAELNRDIKKDVMEAVTSRMTAICTCTGSRNLEPSLPVVVKATHTLTTTIECVEKFEVCISCAECGSVLASLGCDVSSALT